MGTNNTPELDLDTLLTYKVYPVLKTGDWQHLQSIPVRQTFFGTQEQPKFAAVFAFDTPQNFVYVNQSLLQGIDVQQFIDEAYDNLEQVPSLFQLSEQFQNKLLTASGHPFSSEKILSKTHMLQAHELLNSNRLLVSIPRRTCMMIIPENAEKDHFELFLKLHHHAWLEDSYGNPQLTSALFTVVNGAIDNMYEARKPE